MVLLKGSIFRVVSVSAVAWSDPGNGPCVACMKRPFMKAIPSLRLPMTMLMSPLSEVPGFPAVHETPSARW